MSDQHAAGTAAFDMPPLSAGFDARGGWLVNRLAADLALEPIHGAAIAGVFGGGESGLEAVHERGVPANKGGIGWAQWTGTPGRRQQFEAFCAERGWKWTDDEANYAFLVEELRGSEARSLSQLRKTTAIDSAVYTFVTYFERSSDHDTETARSIPWAKRALAAATRAPLDVVWKPPGNNWPAALEPAPWPLPRPAPPAASPVPASLPPVANGVVAGGLALVAMMFVEQVTFGLSLLHVAVPDKLQNLTVGGLVVLIGWFLHTRLSPKA